MTVRELIYSTNQELEVVIVSYIKLYNSDIELKFNSHNIKNHEYIISCDVRDWKIEDKSSIKIWTGDDLLKKLIGKCYREGNTHAIR